MEFFYTIREPLYQLIRRISPMGMQFIPSSRKKVFSTLFFIIFVMVSGVGIVVPLLPLYATNLGATGLYVSMIFASFSLSRTLLLPLFGRMSDKKGRKPFIMVGLLCYVLVSIALYVSTTVNQLIVIRFFQGVGSAMIFPVAQAYVGEITPQGSEGYSMGLFNLSMFISLSLGPMLGGVIQDIWTMETAFLWMGVLSFLGLLMCGVCLPPVKEEYSQPKDRYQGSWMFILKDWEIWSLCGFRYAYTASIGAIWSFLPLLADEKFALSTTKIGILVSFGVFVSGVLQVPMGLLSDRVNRSVMVYAGGILSAAGMGSIFFASGFGPLLLALGLFGLGGGISTPALTALSVQNGERKKAMGAVMSLMTTAHSLGMLTGALAAGIVMDMFSLDLVFPGAGIFMTMGTVFFIVIDLVQKKRNKNTGDF